MSSGKDLDIVLSLSEKSFQLSEPTREEVISAINSVPSIRAKEQLIADLPNSARYIKGYPVLTEGTYNGAFYPDEVLRRDAKTWIEHDFKPGMNYKVKLEHKGTIQDRVGHILNSYYDENDNYVKQDFLLLNQKAIELWDQGFLDDISIRAKARAGIQNDNSGKRIVIQSLNGIGSDFTDNPACKTAGLDVLLEEMEEEKEFVDLEDNGMSVKKTEGEQIKSMFVELGEKVAGLFKSQEEEQDEELEDKEEQEEENPAEEEKDEEQEEKPESEEEEEAKPEPEEEDEEEEQEEVEEESEEELSDKEAETMNKEFMAQLDEMKESFETRLDEIEGMYKTKIGALEAELAEAEEAKAKKVKDELIGKAVELSAKCNIELKAEDLVELEDKVIEAKVETFEAILSQVPEGELPRLLDVSLEQTNEKVDEEIAELEEKARNQFMG